MKSLREQLALSFIMGAPLLLLLFLGYTPHSNLHDVPSGSQFIVQGASRGIGLYNGANPSQRLRLFVLATCRGIPSRVEALANCKKYENRLN